MHAFPEIVFNYFFDDSDFFQLILQQSHLKTNTNNGDFVDDYCGSTNKKFQANDDCFTFHPIRLLYLIGAWE